MLIRRLQNTKGRTDLRAEMESHLQERVAELCGSGWSESTARAEARRLFGNVQIKQEESREIWIARYWPEVWTDVRNDSRTLVSQPAFALAAVAALVLAIGFNSVLFSVYTLNCEFTVASFPPIEKCRGMNCDALNQSSVASKGVFKP
jgi:3-phenylpropionate/cinnamic acid dioxygenase small subunit